MPADGLFDAVAAARSIARVMEPDGCIPYQPGGVCDPWDHIEAAMALSAAGLRREAERAYLWMAGSQRGDGSWPSAVRAGRVEDATADANFAAYIATGLHHHSLATGDWTLVEELWDTVERAVDFALGLQAPGGEIAWARDPNGKPWPGALLAGSSCIHLSLRCAIALAARLSLRRPDWQSAHERLGDAIRARPQAFEDKSRWAMDWYYPVLGGALTGEAARRRLRERWDQFVVAGLGCRCVADRPWVTVAETAELVIALEASGLRAEAVELFSWIQGRRDEDGAYWCGITFPEAELWPAERPTWTSGAVVLAADALYGEGPAAGLFREGGAEPLENDLEPVA